MKLQEALDWLQSKKAIVEFQDNARIVFRLYGRPVFVSQAPFLQAVRCLYKREEKTTGILKELGYE